MILQLCVYACLVSTNLINGKPIFQRSLQKRSSENDHQIKTADENPNDVLNAVWIPSWLGFYKTVLDNIVDDKLFTELAEPNTEMENSEIGEVDNAPDVLNGDSGDFSPFSSVGIDEEVLTTADEVISPELETTGNDADTLLDFQRDSIFDDSSLEETYENGETKVNDDNLEHIVGIPWLIIQGLRESAEHIGDPEIDMMDDINHEISGDLIENESSFIPQGEGDGIEFPDGQNSDDIVTFDDINKMFGEDSTDSMDSLSNSGFTDTGELAQNLEWTDSSDDTDSTLEIGNSELSAVNDVDTLYGSSEILDSPDDVPAVSGEPSDDSDGSILESNTGVFGVDVNNFEHNDEATVMTGELSTENDMLVDGTFESNVEIPKLNDDSTFEPVSSSDDSNIDSHTINEDANLEVAKLTDDNKFSLELSESKVNDLPVSAALINNDHVNDEPVT